MSLKISDRQRPWLTPFLPLLKTVVDDQSGVGVVRNDWRECFNALATEFKLANHQNQPIRFVPQASLPLHVAYESFIGATGNVPTRENLHDFFNALTWLTYPTAKAAVNSIHHYEIDRMSTWHISSLQAPQHSSSRGNLRDRATIFDENGALMLTCDSSIAIALAAHEWNEVLLRRRDEFGLVWDLALFGHALLEKLVNPFKAITAHVWVLVVEPKFFKLVSHAKCAAIDALLCEQINQEILLQPPAHLPILGVPGWWTGQDERFYQDANVFRAKRA